MDHDKSLRDISFKLICNKDYMFYGLFLSEINKAFTKSVQTACIGKHRTSNNIEMRFNPDFWEKYCPRDSQKTCLLIHEVLHMVFEHISEMSSGIYLDKKIANIAHDLYINQKIKEEFPCDEKGEPLGVFLSTYKELKLKEDESSLYYYRELMKAKEEKQKSADRGEDSKAGPKGNGNGTSGSKALDQQIEADEDIHASWDELTEGMSDMEKELLRRDIRQALVRAAEETAKMKGDVPANLLEAIQGFTDLEKPVVSWRDIFNRFIGSCISSDQYQTRKRPNYRFDGSPASKLKSKIRVLVSCDQSGSMSEDDISQINSQLYHIWKSGVKVYINEWDAEATEHREYKGSLSFQRVKCGGTRLGCAIDYANLHRQKFDCVVIGTDGYVENDIPISKVPCMIVITANGTDQLNTKHKVVKING